MSEPEELSPRERAHLRSRDRKVRLPKMVVDNAAVKRIQLALRARAQKRKKQS